MKAKYLPRIDLVNRTRLETVIPLYTPFIVFVDPSDACNFHCKFCPTSDRSLMREVGRPWKQLSFDLFKKIAKDLTYFQERVKVLRLYKDGEPLLNKSLPDMIKYAKDINAAERIDTTTNASLLTPEKGKALIESGLDLINISIYGVNNEQYKQFSGVTQEFDRILANVKSFYENRGKCEMLVKINGDTLTEEEKQKFLDYFGDYTDRIHIEHIMSCWPEFKFDDQGIQVNKDKGIYGQVIKEVDVCPYPFYSMSINSDGLTSVCFLDWARKMVVGDAKIEAVSDIWNGTKMKQWRKMFLQGERKQHPICGGCGQMSHGMPDDIDQYKEYLLKKLDDMEYWDES